MDSDGNKAPDCNDACSDDPLKVAPDVCGCNKEDKDTDSDGVVDCIDGCPKDSKNAARLKRFPMVTKPLTATTNAPMIH